ncbi:MAG: zinc ribbon domain-containing protein, partial [Oscillospiraceae bacterium]|nr:zinc ribbon domain-containing protein [Oscillospiraceae bacterium]
ADEIRATRARGSGNGNGTAPHALRGKVFCMDCGSPMDKYKMAYKNTVRYYLRCRLYGRDKSRCSGHGIRLDRLEGQILEQLCVHLGSEIESLTRENVMRYIGSVEVGEKNPVEKNRDIRITWLNQFLI